MEISIIGGGITGLTTALALQKMGIEATVYERSAALNEVGAGILVQPNAMRVLNWLGLRDQIRNLGYPLLKMDISNAQLIPFRDASAELIQGDNGEQMVAIHRARLQKVLFESLPSHCVRLDSPYQSHIVKDGRFEVDLGHQKILTDVILGADGINSQVRQSLFPDAKKRYSGQTCWRGIAPMALPKEIVGRGYEAWGFGSRFGIIAISENEVYWFAVSKAPESQDPKPLASHAPLLELFQRFHPLITKTIRTTPLDKIISNDLHDLSRLSSWSEGKICLLGDAAHATTPNMGQGAGQGIEDAYFISQAMAENTQPEEAFKVFEANRRKKVDYVVNNSWRFGKMAHSASGRWFMKTMMRIMPEKAMKRQMEKLFEVPGLS